MKIKSRLGVVMIFCLVMLAGGLPVSNAHADANQKTFSYHYFLPFNSQVPPVIEALGPDGGGLTSVLLDPKQPQTAYVGTWGAGVYKSLDGGKTWNSTSSGLDNLFVQSMVIDPIHPEIIYTGTYHSGVYKTANGGATWVYSGKGLNTDAIVYALAIDPINPNIIYAGTRSPGSNPPWGGGVFKSTNGGATWANFTNNLGEDWVYGLAVNPSNTQTIYAATHSQGVFKSTNGGTSWAAVNNGISDQSMRTVAIDPSNTQVVYAGCWHTTGVFKTTNGGQSWTAVSNGLNGAKIITLVIDPVRPQTIYALSYLQGVYKTDNGGGNWSNVGLSPYYVFGLTVDPTNRQTLLITADNVALFRSTNGGASWVNSSSGLHATTVTSVAVDQKLPGVVYAGLSSLGVTKSSDSGKTWASANAGLGDLNVRSMALVSGSLYVGTDSGGIYKLAAQQASFNAVNTGLPKSSGKTPLQNPALSRFNDLGPAADLFLGETDTSLQPKAVAISTAILALMPAPSDAATLYAGTSGSGVYRTTNAGASWQSAGLSGMTIFSLAIDRFNPSIAFAGTTAANGGIWWTPNGGAAWANVKTGMDGVDVLSIIFHPSINSVMYAGTSQGVYQSITGGSTWTHLGLNGQTVYALVINPDFPQMITAGTTTGLYISYDSGATWAKQPGLINPEVWCLAAGSQSTNSLFIGTKASGLYRFVAPPLFY